MPMLLQNAPPGNKVSKIRSFFLDSGPLPPLEFLPNGHVMGFAFAWNGNALGIQWGPNSGTDPDSSRLILSCQLRGPERDDRQGCFCQAKGQLARSLQSE